MTPPNDPLKPWKSEPPKQPDEAAAASLLQEIRSMPTLSPEALARVERRIRDNATRRRTSRSVPIFAALRPAVFAGAMGLALVVGGLTYVMERQSPRFEPSQGSVAMAPASVENKAGTKAFGAPVPSPDSAPALGGALATRQFSTPPPGAAPSDYKATGSVSHLDNLGAGFNGAPMHGGGRLGLGGAGASAPAGFFAERSSLAKGKAKKARSEANEDKAEPDSNGPVDLFAANPAPQVDRLRGASAAGADMSDQPMGELASAEPIEKPRPTAHRREAMPAEKAPMAPPATPRMDTAKDEYAEAPAARGPSPSDDSARVFAAPPPPAASAPAPSLSAAGAELEGQMAQEAPAKQRSQASSEDALVRRGEDLARSGRCPEAIEAFSPVANGTGRGPLVERALIGRARCRLTLGQDDAARQDFSAYLSRFPAGRFATEARARLQ